MIKILIVEDSKEKFEDIKKNIISLNANHTVEHATTINNAKRLLLRNQYELLIVDIKLPENENEEIINDGGIRLIKEIKSIDVYHIPQHIIAITQHSDSIIDHKEFFDKEFSQIIPYDPSSQTYAERLQDFLIKINDINYRNNKSPHRPYECDLAIVCALRYPELEAILKWPANWQALKLPNDPTHYFKGELVIKEGKTIHVVATNASQMGMSATAVASMKMISNFTPRFLAMTGIAAGVKSDKTNIGDILVPDISYDYGSGKFSNNETGETLFLNEPQQYRLSAEVKSNLEQIQNDSDFLERTRIEAFALKLCKSMPEKLNIHIGAIGSGSAVVSDEKLINEKKEKQTRRLIGIEMEIYGLFAATHNSTLPAPTPIIMKSICDWGDNAKNKEFQEYASFTSAKVLFEYVNRYL